MVSSLLYGTQNGTVELYPDGSFNYTPDVDFSGEDSFTYRVLEIGGGIGTATVTLSSNNAPETTQDSYNLNEDTVLEVSVENGVLANDSDNDGDALTATLTDAPQHGSVVLNPDGSFVYTPDDNYNGIDSFGYAASDGISQTEGQVALGIVPIDDVPVVTTDNYTTPKNTLLIVPAELGVLINDVELDEDSLIATLNSPTTNGVVIFNFDGSFGYQPNNNFIGVDSFQYSAGDSLGNFVTGEVFITVDEVVPNDTIPTVPVDDIPVIQRDVTITSKTEESLTEGLPVIPNVEDGMLVETNVVPGINQIHFNDAEEF
jgi:VCBS repeat-containing protein